MRIGILCPGQGAQMVGMGIKWAEHSPAAARVFQRCSEALGLDLGRLCAGPAQELTRTDVCQPAIFATSAACLAALELERPSVALGLSLGEYTALYAAGVLELEDAVRLVRLRGIAMQEASEAAPSGMTTILGATRAEADELCAAATADGGVCVVANLNAPGQVVLSGAVDALDRASEEAAKRGMRHAIRLDVAGAFHSPLMEPARERLEKAIAEMPFSPARFPVIGNVDATPTTAPDRLRRNLVEQLTAPVLFEASLRRAIADGAQKFVELSPGRVLSGLVRKIDRRFPVESSGRDRRSGERP